MHLRSVRGVLVSAWPHFDLPGAGPLGEHELDAACWRKRSIVLTDAQLRAVDETAGLCGVCGGECPTPQACEHAERLQPVEPSAWVRSLLAHPVRWSFAIGSLFFLTVWLTKPGT